MTKRLIFLVSVMVVSQWCMTSCGDSEGEDMVGVANNPSQFFGCTLGDDADDVIETLKDAKTYKVSVDEKAKPLTVTLTGKRKSDAVKWRNTNYDRVVLNMSDDQFTSIELSKTYASKGALTKWLNRQDQNEEALVGQTDSTRTYIIKGEESRCSIWVDIPSRVVNTTYTDNRVWVKQSAWDKIVNFVCNPFDNIWSLAMWAIILGLGYLVYTKYKEQIAEAVDETEEEN